MTTTIEAAIRFEDVSYHAGGIRILKNITGSFPKGQITTLVGPSGAGKTSLFKLCNGLQSPCNGEIFVFEKNIDDYHPVELRRTVGLALQQAPMISGTVLYNVALPLKLQNKRLPLKKAKELMELVGLDETLLQRNVKKLSGGQRQKLSIARTLVNRPKVLLLDEITSSLDKVSQQDIEQLIVKINKMYKTTIIWITHNLHQAREIGDYTWVMMDGEVIESGETSLLDCPKTERVQRFITGEER
ncbi:MAG TPA: phosphate ABC transporter ATP-binding protein [Bacillota bacterium]